jgi:hypothetical protein
VKCIEANLIILTFARLMCIFNRRKNYGELVSLVITLVETTLSLSYMNARLYAS